MDYFSLEYANYTATINVLQNTMANDTAFIGQLSTTQEYDGMYHKNDRDYCEKLNGTKNMTAEERRICLTVSIALGMSSGSSMKQWSKELSHMYPHIKSGIVDSCEGYFFPECPGWKVSSDKGNDYYYDVIVMHSESERSLKQLHIYTAIAGLHRTLETKDMFETRSLECTVLNQTTSNFTIRMTTSREAY